MLLYAYFLVETDRTRVDLPCATCPIVPTLIVAYLLITSCELGVSDGIYSYVYF
jgi:hypothetical protein